MSLSQSALTYSTQRDDNDLYCVTEAEFEIGQMIFTLTQPKTNWSFTATKTVKATASYRSENETCVTDLNIFVGNMNLYASLGLNEAVLLQ